MAKLFFVILTFAFFQASNASIIKLNLEKTEAEWSIIEDLILQCTKLIESLNSTFQTAISNGLKQLTGLKDTIEQIKTTAIAQAKNQFQGAATNGLAQINIWKFKAQQLGVDVKSCYEDNENKIKNLPQSYLDKENSCVTKEYDNTMNNIKDSEKTVTELINKFKNLNLPEKLKQCSGWSAISCLYNLISEVTALTTALPGQVTQKVAEVTTFVSGLQGKSQLCTIEQDMSMQGELTNIVGEAIKCLKQKLNIPYKRQD